MKRTALILAGAVVLDLGVMTGAVQAWQQVQTPPVRSEPTRPAPASPGPMSGAVVVGPGGTGGCTPRGPIVRGRPGGCPAPAAISDQAAAGNLTAFLPGDQTGQADSTDGQVRYNFTKIEYIEGSSRSSGALTVASCRAQGGEVVQHEGEQQCRRTLPSSASVPGNPRPGGIPPRN